MSLKLFAGQLLALVGLGAATPAAPTPTATTSSPVPTSATPTFPIPNWNGTIPKGAALYRYKYAYDGHKGTIEVLARNEVNAQAKARKRVESHYGESSFSYCSLELVGKASG